MSRVLRHVLVPLDGSALAERALPFARVMASAFDARLTLLQVLPPPPGPLPVNPLEWEIARAQAERYLDRVARSLGARDRPAAWVVEQGRPAQRILGYAKDNEVDLIVLHSHGEGGPVPWQLGETAHLLVGSAVASVLIVPIAPPGAVPRANAKDIPDTDEAPPRRVLVTLDGSPRAECVLPVAMGLALATDAEVLLCHVVAQPELIGRLGASPENAELARRLVARNEEEATRYLEHVCRRLASSGVRCGVRVITASHAADAIRELADRERFDLVLTSAHGKGGRCAQPHGSVADAVAHRPTRPLLILQDHRCVARAHEKSPRRAAIARAEDERPVA